MAKAKRSADKAQAYRKSFNLAALTAVILAILCTVGGTLAWIVSVPDPVVNTFTYGEIEITLEETDSPIDEADDPEDQNTYMMAPGIEIDKDPTVTVKAGSEDCWLFVKLEKSENFDDFMTYVIAYGWTKLDGADGVYYRKVEASDEDEVFSVLKDNQVEVKGEPDVTDDMLNALGPDDGDTPYPTLNITAYAVQYMGFEPEDGENASNAAAKAWKAALGEEVTTESTTENAAAGNSTENNNGRTVSDSAAAAAYSANAPRFYWGEDSIFTIKGEE